MCCTMGCTLRCLEASPLTSTATLGSTHSCARPGTFSPTCHTTGGFLSTHQCPENSHPRCEGCRGCRAMRLGVVTVHRASCTTNQVECGCMSPACRLDPAVCLHMHASYWLLLCNAYCFAMPTVVQHLLLCNACCCATPSSQLPCLLSFQ